jgi:protein translocase SecG subunit
MLDVLKFIEIIISILLIFIILIQNKNVSLNLASMSGGMWEVTKRWAEKVLHNATVILWVLFVLNSIALFLLS